MRLVVVGSMAKAWTPSEALRAMDLIGVLLDQEQAAWRERHDAQTNTEADQQEEFVVGSGRSPSGGVDVWVEAICEQRGIPFVPFPPKARNWPAYKVRDQAMADWCTKLIRVKSVRSTTYGSGWTRDQAVKQGKPAEEYTPNAVEALT